MIYISNKVMDTKSISNIYSSDKVEESIISKMSASDDVYMFKTVEELIFELKLRTNIVSASRELNKSDFYFRTFRKSKCNDKYWNRTKDGGFLVNDNAKPSEAINDIFINGAKYATECATAIVIIYYKALLEVFGIEKFDIIFSRIHLMNWHYLNNRIGIFSYIISGKSLPGDCVYFKNPDVNPLTPEWQGENAIDLDNESFYGHGLGIKSSDVIIYALNKYRKENSTESAYLTKSVTRPSYKQLAKIYSEINKDQQQ